MVSSYSSYRKLIQSPSWDPDLVLKILESENLDPARALPKDFFFQAPPSVLLCDVSSLALYSWWDTYYFCCPHASFLLEISRSYRHLTLKLDPLNNNSELWHGLFVILASNMSGLFPFGTVDWLCGISQCSSQSRLSF